MTVAASDEIRRRALEWLRQDPDPSTRAELLTLLTAAGNDLLAAADLADRFAGPLAFGTAGLRGAVGAGPNRMNRVVVASAAAGLAAYLLSSPGRGAGGVVVGYDARHRSVDFARDTAEVVRGAGLGAFLLPEPLPTPVLAFAVRHLGCAAGVMVTASHNPARDNGFKVYLGDGVQIVPPVDGAIAAEIDRITDISGLARSADCTMLGPEVVDAYVAAVAALVADGPRKVRTVYTALHGVGQPVVQQVVAAAGFAPPMAVPAQAVPDPDFPTVEFPNPEEPGAMDLALALADEQGADLVIGNDPDADRCAVAVPFGGGWRQLRGDELGVLLADRLLRRGVTGTYATTIVSASLLAAMCAAYDQPYVETLTGFKWLGHVDGLVFGYEEALGYCVAPEVVRDKDGISALLLTLELAAELKAEGRTLLDRLDELAVEFGLHATDQLSLRVADLRRIPAALCALRDEPPRRLGGLAVERVDDLARAGNGLPPTDGLRFRLARGARVVVRPSGTEPKLKCYLEVVVPVAGSDVGTARDLAAERLAAIRAELAGLLAR